MLPPAALPGCVRRSLEASCTPRQGHPHIKYSPAGLWAPSTLSIAVLCPQGQQVASQHSHQVTHAGQLRAHIIQALSQVGSNGKLRLLPSGSDSVGQVVPDSQALDAHNTAEQFAAAQPG
jgi:hypothetical protein